jgi:hypothetical protein
MTTTHEADLSPILDVVDGSRIQGDGDRAVYLAEVHWTPLGPMYTRRYIPNPDTYNNLFRNWDGILVLSRSDLSSIFRGRDLPDGATLVKSDDGSSQIFLLDYDGKRPILLPGIFEAYWFDPGRVITVPTLLLSIIHESRWVGA